MRPMHQLKVNQRQTIVSLHEQGWSKRKIARELALDRATVRGSSQVPTDRVAPPTETFICHGQKMEMFG